MVTCSVTFSKSKLSLYLTEHHRVKTREVWTCNSLHFYELDEGEWLASRPGRFISSEGQRMGSGRGGEEKKLPLRLVASRRMTFVRQVIKFQVCLKSLGRNTATRTCW